MHSKAASKLCFLLVLTYIIGSNGTPLEQVDDGDLVHLLTGEDNVIALFTKNQCHECDELEAVLENIQADLKETLGAVVVKAHNSNMVGIYDPTREPSLIYFRRGIPLLYHGEINEDEIIHTFSDNRDPVVKELSDQNFEHLTQAATGATTGDWFIFFYSADCVLCQRLYAVWEAVGAKLKRRLNVARVNRLEAGISTAKRFGIKESPEFIFLRQGKVYRYKSKTYTPKSFIDFAETGYRKQTHPEAVPQVANPMNDFLASNLKALTSNPQFITFGGIAVAMIVFIFVIVKCLSKKTKTTEKKNKKAK